VRSPADAASASRTLASTLAMHLKAPDLSRMGYKLASVEIYDHVAAGKAVELVYRRADNRSFALYVRHATGAARFDEFTQGKMRVCIWQDEVLGTVMTGEMSAAEMQRLASLAYSGLET
jgi:anti-sigma factor RsiW